MIKLKSSWIVFLIAVLACVLSLNASAADVSASYTWKPLKIGGGGWITGMDYTRAAGVIYCRTDQSGAYRWDPTTSTWKQLVTATSLPAGWNVSVGDYAGVESIVGTNTNSSCAYLAYEGEIFRSANKGDTWDNTWATTAFSTLGIAMDEISGAGRFSGERIGVDPNNNNNVYFCPMNDYLCRCPAYHGAWSRVTAVPAATVTPAQTTAKKFWGVTSIKFDKNSGTTGGNTNVIYVTVEGGGVWRSADAGTTWANIASSGPGNAMEPRKADVGTDGNYYVTYGKDDPYVTGFTGAVWKYSPTAGTWTDITPTSTNSGGDTHGGNQDYQGLSVDPTNSSRVTVMTQSGRGWTSTNGGVTWTYQSFDFAASTSIPWLGALQSITYLSVGAIRYDPNVSGQLWLAQGFGMWNTTDIADTKITWVEHSEGIEETVGNTVIAPAGGQPVTASWDVGVFYHSNPDLYNARRARNTFGAAWDLDWSPGTTGFVTAIREDNLALTQPVYDSGYSTDGGQTWNRFGALGDGSHTVPGTTFHFGNIAVARTNTSNLVWCPAYIGGTNANLPYYTTDKGATWSPCNFGVAGVTQWGQCSNGNRPHPLAADRYSDGVFYLYAPHTSGGILLPAGIYKSSNGGSTWTRMGNAPANNMYNATLKASIGATAEGDLWFAGGFVGVGYAPGGLYHSTNSGASWTTISNIQAISVGFGKAATGSSFATIFVSGNLKVGTTWVPGIYRSIDNGATWDTICNGYPLGIYSFLSGIDGDKAVFGKVYGSTYAGGDGHIYGATSGP